MNPLLVGGLFDVGKTLIERLFPDKEQAAKAQLELLRMDQAGELKQLEVRMSAILAEAQSNDKWTSRARPSFMYVFYVVILSMTLVAPLVGIFFPDGMENFFDNVTRGFVAIPEELWWAFSVGYLGYAGARSFEKTKGVK